MDLLQLPGPKFNTLDKFDKYMTILQGDGEMGTTGVGWDPFDAATGLDGLALLIIVHRYLSDYSGFSQRLVVQMNDCDVAYCYETVSCR